MRKYVILASERPFAVSLLVCVLFGFLSLLLGQDRNWDLLNYHLYNPYALFNHKIDLDIAPAGFQGYFNPLLDIPYYWMVTHWPAPVAGFVFGAWHGVAFGLLYVIAVGTLSDNLSSRPRVLAIWLAAAGTCSTNILFGLGNSMGDTTVTVIILGSLALVVWRWPTFEQGHGGGVLLAAGLLAGAGAGLKLTNVPYALALWLSFAIVPLPGKQRVRFLLIFGTGAALGGLAATGWWWLRMWQTFGNPLFPQFSHWFPHPWALPTSIADTRWLPKTFLDAALWPFIFTLNGAHVGEDHLHQLLWPLVYGLFIAWGIAAWRQRRQVSERAMNPVAIYVLTVLAVGYLIWMKLFSIYRYTGPLEALLPLATWFLWHRLLPGSPARYAAAWSIAISMPFALLLGAKSWGHDSWASQAFRIQTPIIAQSKATTVLLIGAPLAWIETGFSPDIAFASVASSFPANVGYWKAIQARIIARGGDVFAIVSTTTDGRAASVRHTNDMLDALGLTSHTVFCSSIGPVARHLKLHIAPAARRPDQPDSVQCSLTSLPQDIVDVAAIDRGMLSDADQALSPLGMKLDITSCRLYPAYIGQDLSPYQWCKVIQR